MRSIYGKFSVTATVLTVAAFVSYLSFGQFGDAVSAQQKNDYQVIVEFSDWLGRFRNGQTNVEQGKVLAAMRLERLQRLVVSDPKAVIDNAIGVDDHRFLPDEIKVFVEEPVSFTSDYEVVYTDIADAQGNFTGSRLERFVTLNGVRYPAIVYGRRLEMTTKTAIPLNGVLLGDKVVLTESPFRDLNLSMPEKPVADVGGKTEVFASKGEFDNFLSRQIEWESKIGPGPFDWRDPNQRPESAWTEGTKRVLLMLLDFADQPGTPTDPNGPFTPQRAQDLFSQQIDPFYIENSYGKTSVKFGAITPVMRMPRTWASYIAESEINRNNSMITDARNAARALGFETNNYELDVVVVSDPNNQVAAGGQGALGAKGMWWWGFFDFRVSTHEIGHNFGSNHANLWQTTDGSVIGAAQSLEYGDPHDIMGALGVNADLRYHFNTKTKHRFDWLTGADVTTVTENGVYRIFRHDINPSTGARAIRVRKDGLRDYWLEFRQKFTADPNLMNGVAMRWHYFTPTQVGGAEGYTQLLDITPGGNGNNAALQIGQNFLDDQNRIRFTVVGFGNTTPQSLDVSVEVNVGCTFDLPQPTVSVSSSGGLVTAAVNTQAGCRLRSTTDAPWLTPLPTEDSSVRILASPNYSSTPRTGTVMVEGRTLTVTQAAATTACAANPAGNVAWWRADGNAKDHVGSNDGVLFDGMAIGAGKVAGGFVGDGVARSRVNIPDSQSLAITQSLSIEGWLRMDENTDTRSIISRGPTTFVTGAWFPAYWIYVVNSRVTFSIANAPNGTTAGVSTVLSTIPVGQFVHFAATLDNATGVMRLYINGVQANQTTTTLRPYGNFDPAQYGLGLGNVNTTATYNAFKGALDEVGIYNRALTATEIQAIFNAGNAGTGAAGKCLEASATISGRVTTPGGQALRNAVVSLIDPQNVRRTATTSSFGTYSFANVATGQTHTLTVASKRYRFSPRTLPISSSIANLDLVGLE